MTGAESAAEHDRGVATALRARRRSDASFKALVCGLDRLSDAVTEAIEVLREHTSSRPPPAQPSG
jgi:hypothetical protein